jgi:hypothetical protein
MKEYTVRVYTNRTEWRNNGKLHRDDGPAIEYKNGDKLWYQHDKLHRLDGPAIEYENGSQLYFLNDIEYSKKEYWKKVNSASQINTTDQGRSLQKMTCEEFLERSGREMKNKTQEYIVKVDNIKTAWYNTHHQLHREDGPALEYINGDKFWYFNGKRHRVGGPAIELADGDKFWYCDDKRHREDGPAIIRMDGRVAYWLNNIQYSEQQHRDKINQPAKEMTIEEIQELLGHKVKIVDIHP